MPVSLNTVSATFGGTAPHGLKELYGVGFDDGGVAPASGPINLRDFDGKLPPPSELFPFTSHTFTNCGASGRLGPDFGQMKNAYASTVWELDTAWFNQISGKQGLQLWTVPMTGTFRITAYGGSGGENGAEASNARKFYGGLGGYCRGDFPLTIGEKLIIIVGHHGVRGHNPTSISNWVWGGGGGGTYVLKESYLSDPQVESIYIVAGGGAGAGPYHAGGGGGAQGTDTLAAVHDDAGNSSHGHGPGGGVRYNGVPHPDDNPVGAARAVGRSAYNGSEGGLGGYGSVGGYYWNEGSFGGGGGNSPHAGGGGGGYSGGDTHHYGPAGGGFGTGSAADGGTCYVSTYAHNQVGNITYSGTHGGQSTFGSVYIQGPGQF